MRLFIAVLIPFFLLACSPREQPIPSDTSTPDNQQASTTPTEPALAFDPTADLDKGNPEIGRAYFFVENRGRCLKCHTLNGEGDSTGTPLDDTGLRFKPDYLATFIFNPRMLRPEVEIMPPWRGDPEAKIADIVAFLMTLKIPVDHPPTTDVKPSDEPLPYEGGVGGHGRYNPDTSS
jgi:mono/diheme cytochrome c family protein